MLTISVRTNIDQALKDVRLAEGQARFAVSKSLNKTGQLAKEALSREIIDTFDRPKDYTINSPYLKPSNKAALVAEVGLKDVASKQSIPASKYLLPSIKGGLRRMKRFERALRAVGVLPEGMVAVAGQAATMDPYGNVSQGQIVQLLSYFRGLVESGSKANIISKRRKRLWAGTKRNPVGRRYFVGRPANGRLPLGIWQVRRHRNLSGTELQPILIFVDGAIYERRFELRETIEFTVHKHFDRELRIALVEAGMPRA